MKVSHLEQKYLELMLQKGSVDFGFKKVKKKEKGAEAFRCTKITDLVHAKTGCGVLLPEHMLKLASDKLEKIHSWLLELMLQKGSLDFGFNTS